MISSLLKMIHMIP